MADVVCGTGHRPNKLGGYKTEVWINLVRLATYALKRTKPNLVISGIAQGWDQALAQAALDLNIPFNAYVPFAGQDRLWTPQSQRYYQALLRKAQTMVVVSHDGNVNRAMQLRNERMVDDSQLVLALWNGDEFGGTYNCLQYANKLGRPIQNFWNLYAHP